MAGNVKYCSLPLFSREACCHISHIYTTNHVYPPGNYSEFQSSTPNFASFTGGAFAGLLTNCKCELKLTLLNARDRGNMTVWYFWNVVLYLTTVCVPVVKDSHCYLTEFTFTFKFVIPLLPPMHATKHAKVWKHQIQPLLLCHRWILLKEFLKRCWISNIVLSIISSCKFPDLRMRWFLPCLWKIKDRYILLSQHAIKEQRNFMLWFKFCFELSQHLYTLEIC